MFWKFIVSNMISMKNLKTLKYNDIMYEKISDTSIISIIIIL